MTLSGIRLIKHDSFRKKPVDNFMDINAKVKKPVEAIQCANTFSLLQRKMYNVLLANAAGNLFPGVTHCIPMGILCKIMGYNSKDYKTIYEKFKELRRMDIEWDIINENGNKVLTNTSPLAWVGVVEGEGICKYQFAPGLIPYLDRPAQYAKFSLLIQSKFKSSYGLALYENCERYRNIGQSRSFTVSVFRKLMGVNDQQYLDFFALKRRVIAIAVKEVNQYADFNVEVEYEKKGRVVIALKFLIKNKKYKEEDSNNDLLKPLFLEEDGLLLNHLSEFFGINRESGNKYILKYGSLYVKQKVEGILNSVKFKEGAIKNMQAYLKKALSEDWDFTSNFSSKQVLEKKKKERECMLQKKEEERKKLEIIKTNYENYLNKEIYKLIISLPHEEKSKLIIKFEQYLQSPWLQSFRKAYREKGLDSFSVMSQLKVFIKNEDKGLLNGLCTFEQFLESNCEIFES